MESLTTPTRTPKAGQWLDTREASAAVQPPPRTVTAPSAPPKLLAFFEGRLK